MKYHGIVTACVVRTRCGKGSRYKAFFSHYSSAHGKRVKNYELLEDDTQPPVKVTRSNIREFHKFFTQPTYPA